jgi:uncharacterized protein
MEAEMEEKPLKERLRISQFLKMLKKNGIYCLFHSLTMETVYGEEILKNIYELFSKPRYVEDVIEQLSASYTVDVLNCIITDLNEKGLIVSNNESDLRTYIGLLNYGINSRTITHLQIILTNECNFKCKYCYIKGNRDFDPEYMTEDTAKKGLEVFAKLTENANSISITFYGGEPLLNADIVYSSMRYVRKLERHGVFRRPVNMVLQTNGVLINSDTVNTLLETKANVSVSIDGPKHLHDVARRDSAGKDTFDKVLAGYSKLREAGINPGISCTLNQFNIGHINEIAEFISGELGSSGFSFNPLLPMINSGNPLDVADEFVVSQLINAFRNLRDKGVYEGRIMRRLKPYIDREFYFRDCMAVGGQIVLTPNGKIGPCHAFLGINEFFPLSIEELYSRLSLLNSDDIYKNALFDDWLHRFPLNMEKCAGCFAIAVCGGGCLYASFVNDGSIWEVDERVCHQATQILEWMLWDTYDHIDKLDLNSGKQ